MYDTFITSAYLRTQLSSHILRVRLTSARFLLLAVLYSRGTQMCLFQGIPPKWRFSFWFPLRSAETGVPQKTDTPQWTRKWQLFIWLSEHQTPSLGQPLGFCSAAIWQDRTPQCPPQERDVLRIPRKSPCKWLFVGRWPIVERMNMNKQNKQTKTRLGHMNNTLGARSWDITMATERTSCSGNSITGGNIAEGVLPPFKKKEENYPPKGAGLVGGAVRIPGVPHRSFVFFLIQRQLSESIAAKSQFLAGIRTPAEK